jgi:hypothetical protein
MTRVIITVEPSQSRKTDDDAAAITFEATADGVRGSGKRLRFPAFAVQPTVIVTVDSIP